ncbi:protein FAM200A-like [Diabrotica undecimpunctata]|uniref:protein FAM200A-like n=1 Tax=Diabrotica undecimpunctata TaxID=50387 RepID=UPI003B63AAC7
MALDLKNQLLQKLKGSPFFSLQCDETTDISKHAQLLFYCQFIDRKWFLEQILFSTSLETTTKAIDIFSALEGFLVINELPWEKVIGICIDGTQAMTGCRSGFMELAEKKNNRIIGSHCNIYTQALASQTLPEPLNVTLNLASKIVNHIKSSALNTRLFQALCQELNSDQKTLLFHTEVRWLSKGNMLERLYNLKSKVKILLMTSKQEDFHRRFTDDKNIFYLAYLSDFFKTINVLNLKLQGRKNLLNTYDAIKGLIENISLWQRRLHSSKPNFSSFSKLNDLLHDIQTLPLHLVSDLKDVISRHLEELKNQIRQYFPDVSSENWEFKLTRDSFHIEVDILPVNLQEQAIYLKCDSQAKADFANMDLEEFWLTYFPVYPEVTLVSAKLLVQFSSTYLCESAFSALAYIKSKYRSRLDVESDLRCALTQFQPNIEKLVMNRQCQPSH